MLTRIYGTAFFSQEGARRRTSSGSSRRARATTASSAASSTCSCSPSSRPGSPFWLPDGHGDLERARRALAREKGAARGYREVKTPILYDVELWKTSGHWGKYRENMYFTEAEGREYGPQADELPGARRSSSSDERRSYRDLPIRYAEPGLVHRHEPSGTLHGLLRVRHFTQDDAHIFCTEEQIAGGGQPLPGLRLRDSTTMFGFEPQLELSTRPEKRIGTDEMWDRAEAALRERARRPTGSSTSSTRATAPSTARRSTST